ncbi:MAG: hypothetical protein P1V81_15355 [Planctomycetota bacterium]|nr:hypothetical protein [Planctomycetota bacterium]
MVLEEDPGPGLERVALDLRVLGTGTAPSELVQAGLAPAGELLRIDRGARHGVALADPVELLPRGGAVHRGTVAFVDERTALVRLFGDGVRLEPGVPGVVRVLPAPSNSPEPGGVGTSPGDEALNPGDADGADERPEWQRLRDSWTPDMPLLARVTAERPEQRAFAWGGRWYTRAGLATNLDADRGSASSRTGAVLWAENPFGAGGELDLDVEYDLQTTFVPSEDGHDSGHSRLRFDRASYRLGGTRFERDRHTFGRFLPELPELGALDGYEWSRRLEGGDRIGASVGYRVQSDLDAATGNDLAFSGFYRWVADERELLTASAGVQKSYHNGDRDRDLLVLRFDHRPGFGLDAGEAWDLHGSVLLDKYSDEDFREDGLGLTRALLETGRSWDAPGGKQDHLRLSYRHLELPEQLFGELDPLALASLVREDEDRVQAEGGRWLAEDRRLNGAVSVWTAGGLEDDSGGDLEVGLELLDLAAYGPGQGPGTGEVSVFTSGGRYQATNGLLASYGRRWDTVGWTALYEAKQTDFDGFDADNDDLLQHRLRVTADLAPSLGEWYLAGHADLLVFGDDGGLTLGVYFGRSF